MPETAILFKYNVMFAIKCCYLTVGKILIVEKTNVFSNFAPILQL
jgi:hypothetical protein